MKVVRYPSFVFFFTGKKTKAKTGESIRQVRAVHKITGINAKKRSSQIKNSHTWLIRVVYVGKRQNYQRL